MQASPETLEVSSSQTTDDNYNIFKSEEEIIFGTIPDHSKPVPMNEENNGFVGSDFFDTEGNWHATIIGTTPGGKKVQVMKEGIGSFYRIAFSSGGELPKELQGSFTSYDRAEKHARIWLSDQYGKTISKEAKP